jgi:hypothetical protein
MHDDAARPKFLLDIGGRFKEVAAWVQATEIAPMIEGTYPPTFLHGGSSKDRWIVMGVNPGFDNQEREHVFKRSSPENFCAFHESFFEHFPVLRQNGKQRWWNKLYRVSQVLDGNVAGPGGIDWCRLQDNIVVQDLSRFMARPVGLFLVATSAAVC